MKLNKIKEQLKDLTPQQKLDILHQSLEKEKNEKNKKQIQTLITRTEEERSVLEEELEKLTTPVRGIEEPEEPLEEIVEEASPKEPNFNNNNKIDKIYGADNIRKNIEYVSSGEKKEQEYKSEPGGFSMEKFTAGERKKLKKQEEDLARREYHSRSE